MSCEPGEEALDDVAILYEREAMVRWDERR